MARMLTAFFLAFSGLLVAFGLSWLLLAQMNFSYGFWHDYDNMAETINRNSQKNVLKFGFEKTSKQQREALFAEIMHSVHNGGEGLESITFKAPGYDDQILLVEAEVIHLNDVANLVDFGLKLAVVALIVWLGSWAYFWKMQKEPPSFRLQVLSTLIFIVLVVIAVFIIGPIPVFYQLHEWIFPDGHQWFFYFKESLMATMMHAPILFGWIAVEWLAMALPIFVAIQWGAAKLVNSLQSREAL